MPGSTELLGFEIVFSIISGTWMLIRLIKHPVTEVGSPGARRWARRWHAGPLRRRARAAVDRPDGRAQLRAVDRVLPPVVRSCRCHRSNGGPGTSRPTSYKSMPPAARASRPGSFRDEFRNVPDGAEFPRRAGHCDSAPRQALTSTAADWWRLIRAARLMSGTVERVAAAPQVGSPLKVFVPLFRRNGISKRVAVAAIGRERQVPEVAPQDHRALVGDL